MPRVLGRSIAAYSAAMVIVLLATLVRIALTPAVGDRIPFVTFFVAVALSAVVGGFGPAILSVVLSALSAAYWFIPPQGSFDIERATGWSELGVFTVVGISIALVSESLRKARQQAEQHAADALEQRERWRVTLGSIGDGVVATDTQGRVTFINAVAEQLTAWSLADAAGKPLREVFRITNERTGDPVENPVDKALREGRVVGLANHTVLHARDGRSCAIDDSAAPVRDARGQIIGVVLVFRDVSSSRRVELEHHRLAALVASSEDAIIGETLDGIVTDWNAAAERMFGYAADEAIGKPLHSLIVPESRVAELEAIHQQVIAGERVEHLETTRVHKDGRHMHISLSVSPIHDLQGEVIGIAAIDRNIGHRKELEEQLRSRVHDLAMAEQRVRSVVDNVADGIITFDEQGTIRSFNAAAERLFQYTASEATGQKVTLLLPPAHHNEVELALERYLHGGEKPPSGVERAVEGCRRDGSVFPIDLAVSEFQVAGERLFTGIVRDITDRKRTETALRLLASASASLAVLVDMESTLHRVAQLAVPSLADWCLVDMFDEAGNLQRLAMAGTDDERLDALARLAMQYPARENALLGAQRVARTGKSEIIDATGELLRTTADDDEHLRELSRLGPKSTMCVPLVWREQILGTLTFVYAESGRRYSHDDLAMAEELSYRAAVAIENARLYHELRDADRRKDEFLAMLAHELRNPLAPIRSGLDLLTLASGPPDREIVQLMQHQVEHLVRLVDDLLDVSRIMRGKIELKRAPVSLADVVRRAVDTVGEAIREQEQQLNLNLPPEPVWLDADAVRITQVLDNLLNNACKYTDRQGAIELRACCEDGQVAITVQDTGIGIDKELLPHVFELFTQASSAIDRSQGGLGIGLTLVRNLVLMHGGTVTATSDGPGCGSRFTVRLPVLAAGPQEEEPVPAAVPEQPRRILVVDDNVAAARMLSLLLEKMGGHAVAMVHDGLAALEQVRQYEPDIVLLDIGLPGMSGYDVAQRLRQDPATRELLMVAVSGYGQDEDRRRSLASGFDDHLVKPPEVDKLRELLSHPKLAARKV